MSLLFLKLLAWGGQLRDPNPLGKLKFSNFHQTGNFTLKTALRGLRVVEMPTTYVERRLGASKVVPADFVRGASGALRVGWAYRSGRYR